MCAGSTTPRVALLGTVLGILATFSSATAAHAHEGWFVERGLSAGPRFPAELIGLSAMLASLGFLVAGMALTRAGWYGRIGTAAMPWQRFLPVGMEWRLIATLTGIMLIANSTSGVFLAADLRLPEGWLSHLAVIGQVLIGILLLSQISFALAGLLILVMAVPLAILAFPAPMLVDYVLEYASLGAALIFVGLSSCPDQVACSITRIDARRFSHLPLPIIRIGLGLSLIVLALHNKLADPDIALSFLDKYAFNFVPVFGFGDFSNLHFAFSAGLIELGLGVLLVAGVATRLAAAALFGFFLTTLFLLGLPELVGHLPLFGIALALAYRGSGRYSLEAACRGSIPLKVWTTRSAQ
ncbi:MAG: DoxX family membrane protein [Chloroflexi bacterium]|nr:DoxX family membrane protein [Chloroflexota bacterium]